MYENRFRSALRQQDGLALLISMIAPPLLSLLGGVPTLGTPTYRMGGHGVVSINSNAIKMSAGLLPAEQKSFREVTGALEL